MTFQAGDDVSSGQWRYKLRVHYASSSTTIVSSFGEPLFGLTLIGFVINRHGLTLVII